MHYAYAELLYKTGRFHEALDHYRAVAMDHPDSPHTAFCAEAAVFAARQILELGRADGSHVVAPGLDATEADLMAAIDLALEHADPAKVQALAYQGGYLAYDNEEWDDAASRFADVIAHDPATPEAAHAARLLTDTWAQQQDWDALSEGVLAWTAEGVLGDEALRAELVALAVQLLRDAGRDAEADVLEAQAP
jgi:TolA-binding protein